MRALLVRKVITPELFDEKRILEVIDPGSPADATSYANAFTAQRETRDDKTSWT